MKAQSDRKTRVIKRTDAKHQKLPRPIADAGNQFLLLYRLSTVLFSEHLIFRSLLIPNCAEEESWRYEIIECVEQLCESNTATPQGFMLLAPLDQVAEDTLNTSLNRFVLLLPSWSFSALRFPIDDPHRTFIKSFPSFLWLHQLGQSFIFLVLT